MDTKELVEIILAGRRAARRVGYTFTVDRGRLASMGRTVQDVERAEVAANEIESYHLVVIEHL